MKKLLLYTFFLAVNIHSLFALPRLVLHFDVNKTLIASDLVQQKSLAETINGILAEFTFAAWNGTHVQSYYEYETNNIAREFPHVARSSEEFKQERNKRLRNFAEHLQQNHPALYATYLTDRAAMLEILGSDAVTIFPSFFKLITWLNHSEYKNHYTIHLRTFGTDLPEIVPLIEKRIGLQFLHAAKFEGKTLWLHNGSSVTDMHELYAMLVAGNVPIRDDYMYWKSKNFKAEGGKLFPIDVNDKNVISMFFDDNANDPDKPIICPCMPSGTLESTEKLIERGNIVVVNPKEAILDEDYFVKKIKAVL